MDHAAQAGDGGDVDDAARAPREHLPPQVTAGQERPEQVDVHDPLPLLGGGVFGRLDQADARIVDQHVRRAVMLADPGGERLHERLVGDVADHAVDRRPGSPQPVRGGIERLHVGRQHGESAAREQRCRLESQALCRARNDRQFHRQTPR